MSNCCNCTENNANRHKIKYVINFQFSSVIKDCDIIFTETYFNVDETVCSPSIAWWIRITPVAASIVEKEFIKIGETSFCILLLLPHHRPIHNYNWCEKKTEENRASFRHVKKFWLEHLFWHQLKRANQHQNICTKLQNRW